MTNDHPARLIRRAVLLRFSDEELHRQLADEAKEAERSLNSEIIWRLRASLTRAASATV